MKKVAHRCPRHSHPPRRRHRYPPYPALESPDILPDRSNMVNHIPNQIDSDQMRSDKPTFHKAHLERFKHLEATALLGLRDVPWETPLLVPQASLEGPGTTEKCWNPESRLLNESADMSELLRILSGWKWCPVRSLYYDPLIISGSKVIGGVVYLKFSGLAAFWWKMLKHGWHWREGWNRVEVHCPSSFPRHRSPCPPSGPQLLEPHRPGNFRSWHKSHKALRWLNTSGGYTHSNPTFTSCCIGKKRTVHKNATALHSANKHKGHAFLFCSRWAASICFLVSLASPASGTPNSNLSHRNPQKGSAVCVLTHQKTLLELLESCFLWIRCQMENPAFQALCLACHPWEHQDASSGGWWILHFLQK